MDTSAEHSNHTEHDGAQQQESEHSKKAPVKKAVAKQPGGIKETRPPAEEPRPPCDPDDGADESLQLCRVDPWPADRIVPSAVFIPASAKDHDPINVAIPPAGERRGERPADKARLDEAAGVLRGALKRVEGRDVAMAYLETVTSGTLPAALAPLTTALYQEVGYLMLDRIRMRPSGTVAGDHTYTLGLAPRERVVLTQKAWTKRNVSLEETIAEQLEQEIEFSSSFSTEIGESTEHEQQRSLTTTSNAAISVAYGPIGASVGYGTNAADSSNRTSQQSSRRAREQTRKATDRAKKEHRITFKTETETGIEDVSQRSFENPNTCHSLMLNFFKVFQRFQVFSERWGARACWAPAVVDPGRDLRRGLIDPTKALMTDEERAWIELAWTWTPPDLPPPPGTQTLRSEWSEKVWAGVFGVSRDIKTTIEIPANQVLVSLTPERHSNVTWLHSLWGPDDHPLPDPGATGTHELWWHIGLHECNAFGCPEEWTQIRTVYEVGPSGTVMSEWVEKQKEKRQAEHDRRLKVVQDRIAAENAAAEAVHQAALDAANRRIAFFDPWTELMRRVVAERLTPDRFDSPTEVTLWNDVFEWDAASYELFPNWWNGESPSGGQSQPTRLLNAAWARLYIPIRPGLEMVAFQLLFGVEAAGLQPFVDDMTTFRDARFGSPGAETVIRMAEWEELMPTDGTIVEPLLGNCSACDEELHRELAAQSALVEAQAAALTPQKPKPKPKPKL